MSELCVYTWGSTPPMTYVSVTFHISYTIDLPFKDLVHTNHFQHGTRYHRSYLTD